jgi:hypothetical protein
LGYSKGKSIAKGTSDEDGFSKHMKQSNDYERKAKKIRSDAFRKTKKFNSYKSTLRDDPPRPPYKSKLRDDPPHIQKWSKESVEQFDEATSNYLSKDQLPAKVQRVVTNIFKLAKKEKKKIARLSVELVGKKYYVYVELGRDNNDEDFVGRMMDMETGREKFVEINPSASVHPAPSVSIKESVEQVDELSGDALHRYLAKSMNKSDTAKRLGNTATRNKREKGIKQALKKQTGKAKINATENQAWAPSVGLSPAQRIKAKQRMKRMSKRIQIAKKRAMKRPPTKEKVALRARRQAKNTFIKKWAKGKQKGEMSFAQRAQIEKRLKTAGPRIDRLAKRMIPAVRLQDKERRAMSKEKAASKDTK